MKIVFDIEADGLLDTVTRIHCLVAKNLASNRIFKFTENHPETYPLRRIPEFFKNVKVTIGHNIIGYDFPLLERFFGIKIENYGTIDTYIWSKTLYPDRPMPEGCPTFIKIPNSLEIKKIGPHGLESWGYRVGEKKIEYHDWSIFTPKMLERCEQDVLINEKVFYELQKESSSS